MAGLEIDLVQGSTGSFGITLVVAFLPHVAPVDLPLGIRLD